MKAGRQKKQRPGLNRFLYALTYFFMACLLAVDAFLPMILRFFYSITSAGEPGNDLISRAMGTGGWGHFIHVLIVLYITSVPAMVILWKANRLMKSILERNPFCAANRKHLMSVSVCGFIVGTIYLIGSVVFYSRMILLAIALSAYMLGVIFLVLTPLVVMAAEIKEENDMTI